MIQRLAVQLPGWASRSHPILRYELSRAPRLSKRAQYFRALWIVLLALGLAGGGYLIATNFLRQPAGQNLTEQMLAVVFWPMLVAQVGMRIATILLTGGVISEEKRRQTWDNLRATEAGAELTLRTRWAAVFYRMRPVLAILLGVRVILIIGILVDLTAFQGRYLDLLINGVSPEISLPVAAVLLAFFMTAGLLLPLTGVGFDAASGLLVASVFQQRTYAVIAQILIVLARIVIVSALAFAATRFVEGSLEVSNLGAWLLIAGFAALGDWGLAFLNLGFYGEMWATIPHGIFFGLALLVFSMIQAAATDWILNFAVRQAERKG
jgi:hypothetical protein